MKSFLKFLSLAVLLSGVASTHAAALSGSAIITVTGSGPYQYSITLTNTGTGPIGTFWFSWTPGQNYLATSPTSVQNPTGWNDSITPPGGGYAIQWTTSTPLAAGQTLTGFGFTSADTPAEVFGNSTFFSHPPVGTSTLYGGAPFSDGGFQFVVTAPSVGGSPITITTTNLPDGTNNQTYSQTLTASGGQIPYAWQVSSGNLPKGLTLASSGLLSGKPAGGQFNFTVKVTDASSHTATQALSLTILTPDTTAPKLTITSPKTGTQSGSNTVTVTGTATDNVAVSNVWFSVNSGAWMTANLAGATWTAQAGLIPGTNTFSTYAVDTSGNVSATNSIKIVYIISAPLVVNIAGSGTLKPDFNGQLLAIGRRFTMKATPAKGFGFFFWNVGAALSNNPTLSFTMVSNLVITAHFKDIAPPTLTITSPKNNAKESNSTVNATGTASDNVGVTAVGVQINGNGWMTADGSNNWSATLSATSGANTIEAYAMDAAGNISRTNTVKFTDQLPPDWAPEALTGSTVLVTPGEGNPVTVSFDATTFSQTDTITNGDSGTGAYSYNRSNTNLADLQLTFQAPLNLSNSTPQDMQLMFTNLNAGVFTNTGSSDTGTFSIESAATVVPASWSGHTITASHASNTNKTTVKFTSTSSVTISSPSKPNRTGTYVVTDASPIGAMFVVTYTDAGDAGDIAYLQLTFSSKTAGNYEVNTFDSHGNLLGDESDFGTFTFK